MAEACGTMGMLPHALASASWQDPKVSILGQGTEEPKAPASQTWHRSRRLRQEAKDGPESDAEDLKMRAFECEDNFSMSFSPGYSEG